MKRHLSAMEASRSILAAERSGQLRPYPVPPVPAPAPSFNPIDHEQTK